MTSSSPHWQSRPAKFLRLLTLPAFFATATTACAIAEPPSSGEQAFLQHGPVLSTPARINVPVSVTTADADEILEVRLYFKTMRSADYFFLPMDRSKSGIFTANLPPGKNDTRGIDYLLLFKNSRGEAHKTRPFRLLVLNDYNAPPPAPGELEVLSEGNIAGAKDHSFAVPLRLVTTPEPLLSSAAEDVNPQQFLPEAGSGDTHFFRGLNGLGGISFSIRIGGVGLFYHGFSGH